MAQCLRGGGKVIEHMCVLSFSTILSEILLILCRTQQHFTINPLNAKLNPICHLLALLGGATIVVVSRLRINVNRSSRKVTIILVKF